MQHSCGVTVLFRPRGTAFGKYLWLQPWHDLWLYLWLYLGSVHRVCPLLFCLFHTSAFYHFIRVHACMLWHVDMSLRHIVLSGPSANIVACVCGCGSAWCRAGASGVKNQPVVSNRKHPATPPTGGSVKGSVVPVVVSGYRCSPWYAFATQCCSQLECSQWEQFPPEQFLWEHHWNKCRRPGNHIHHHEFPSS